MGQAQLALTPNRAIFSVFGSIMNNPDLLRDPEVLLTERDFTNDFHKIAFVALHNIIYNDSKVSNVTSVDIDNYIASYPTHYKIWNDNKGMNFVEDAMKNNNESLFKSDYEKIKKFSLLRNYVENGIDVSDIFDYKSNDLKAISEGNKRIEQMSISEIIEHYTQKAINIRDEWHIADGTVKDFKAGDGIFDLLERLQRNPDLGYPFPNLMYNTFFRGMRKGKFLLRSGSTGTGKTRQAINDMLEVTCSHKWETGKGWVSLGPQFPALFISTELEQEELQTIMLAFITGIPDSEIKDGNYDAATAKRLQEGLQIISEAPFFLSYIEDFSISDIEMKIEQYIINEGVQYVAFDYIQMTPKLSKSMSTNFGVTLREDQILVHFSAALKTIASQYQIFLESSTQLNRGSKEVENRDATSLRGGMATADKIDYGVLTFKVNQKDLNNLKPILERGFQQKTPNYSHWIYKNRAGMDYVVIWSKIDLGTMREEILFATDYDYNPVEVSGLEIKFEEVEEDISF